MTDYIGGGMKAAQAMREFAEAVEQSIAMAETQIVARFATRQGSSLAGTRWLVHRNGDAEIIVELEDGSVLTGRGGGRIDAIADAENRLP